MLKAFSKSCFKYIFLFPLTLYTVGAEETTSPPQDQTELNQWEQAESRKIFGIARRFELESNLIEALKHYSEILEFFPNTDVWPLTCIHLSDIYLQRKNITASEKVLKRLVSYRTKKGLSQDENSLLAQWDFFEKLKRFDELILWLEKRNDLEKQKLKESDPLKNRIYDMARNEQQVDLTQMQQLFTAMGYQKPLHALISLLDNPDFLFSEKRSMELMNLCILEEDINLLRRIVVTMQKSGWASSAHQIFSEHREHPEAKSWLRLWVQLLIDAQIWEQVDLLLKSLPQKDWAREILLSSIGQAKWDRAFLEIKAMEKWIFSSLSLDDLETFAKGLQKDPHNKAIYEEFINMIPKGGKKNLLLATLSQDKATKIAILEELKTDSYYGKKATLDLGKLYQKERQFDKIKLLYEGLSQKHPDSTEAKELKLILDTLKMLQKSQPSKTN